MRFRVTSALIIGKHIVEMHKKYVSPVVRGIHIEVFWGLYPHHEPPYYHYGNNLDEYQKFKLDSNS